MAVPGGDAEGLLEIHEDLPKAFSEVDMTNDDVCGDPIIDTDSNEGFSGPLGHRSPSPAQSIVDVDSPPESPYWSSASNSSFTLDHNPVEADGRCLRWALGGDEAS